MRGRSLHATLTMSVVLLASASASRAQDVGLFDGPVMPMTEPVALALPSAAPSKAAGTASTAAHKVSTGSGDALGMRNLFDDDNRLDPSDWAPDHSARGHAAVGATGKQSDKGIDPEPDAAIKPPPTATPSKDPLDAPKPVGAPQPSAEPLPPVEAAIKAALDKRDAIAITGPHAGERRKEREAIDFFYAAHGFAPVWSENAVPVAAVQSVLSRLAQAADDALDLTAVPTTLKTQGTPDEIASSEIALSEAVVAYARQATGSRIDPHAISPLIGARPEIADPAEVLDGVAGAGTDAGDKLHALNPLDPRYAALREKLAELHGARAPTARTIPDGPVLKIGMQDPRVPLIRARFGLDVSSDADSDDLRYDVQVAEAVSGYQRANGLPVSGQLTKRTVASLSSAGSPSRLEGTIIANMEMWRWMPRDLGQDRIEVNVPAYTVTVFHDGDPVASNRVVVGKTDTPTPLFSNTMKFLIVNPVWNVPDSIIEKEFLPKGEGYLEEHGFDVSYKHGKLVVKQPSGAKNALGRIKFIFPNDYSVYLHDTPSKSLFSATKRAFSHGCVRVDQPFDFAFSVLNDSVAEGDKVLWSEKRLQGMLGDKERYVNLPKPLPIHIEYFTAKVEPDTDQVVQLEDIYGYTHDVAVALGQDSGPAVVAQRKPRHVAQRMPTRARVDPPVEADDDDPR